MSATNPQRASHWQKAWYSGSALPSSEWPQAPNTAGAGPRRSWGMYRLAVTHRPGRLSRWTFLMLKPRPPGRAGLSKTPVTCALRAITGSGSGRGANARPMTSRTAAW